MMRNSISKAIISSLAGLVVTAFAVPAICASAAGLSGGLGGLGARPSGGFGGFHGALRIPRHRERRFQTIVSAQSTRS